MHCNSYWQQVMLFMQLKLKQYGVIRRLAKHCQAHTHAGCSAAVWVAAALACVQCTAARVLLRVAVACWPLGTARTSMHFAA
jgi:hypothetical protein